jgi:hypothetical protein
MKKIILVSLICITSQFLCGQNSVQLSEGARVLFKDVKTRLSAADKNAIYSKLGFRLSKDKTQFVIEGGEEYPFGVMVFPTDMNKDSLEEIFISFGNGFTSGNTGSSVSLFIKNDKKTYKDNLGFPGMLPDALTTSNQGYLDILIGGPGFEFPVWRWNGKTYAHHRMVKDKDMSKMKLTSVQDISKSYSSKIKN